MTLLQSLPNAFCTFQSPEEIYLSTVSPDGKTKKAEQINGKKAEGRIVTGVLMRNKILNNHISDDLRAQTSVS